jgi:hypothetical protein
MGDKRVVKLGKELIESVNTMNEWREAAHIGGSTAEGSFDPGGAVGAVSKGITAAAVGGPHGGGFARLGYSRYVDALGEEGVARLVELDADMQNTTGTWGSRGVRMDVFIEWQRCECSEGPFLLFWWRRKIAWTKKQTYVYKDCFFSQDGVKTSGSIGAGIADAALAPKPVKEITDAEVEQCLKMAYEDFAATHQ